MLTGPLSIQRLLAGMKQHDASDLHVKVGNTPTMRLDQDGTLGFPPRAWDIGGNEVSFFIRDVNASSLRLQINPDGSWTTSTGATLTAGGAWTNASSLRTSDTRIPSRNA